MNNNYSDRVRYKLKDLLDTATNENNQILYAEYLRNKKEQKTRNHRKNLVFVTLVSMVLNIMLPDSLMRLISLPLFMRVVIIVIVFVFIVWALQQDEDDFSYTDVHRKDTVTKSKEV